MDVGTVTVHAVSGQHKAVTLGSPDAELYELSKAVASTESQREFMRELGHPQLLASPVYCDNASSVLKSASGKADKRSLYMRKRTTFVQRAVEWADVTVIKIRTELNRADILTKVLAAKTYARLRDTILNVRSAAVNIHAFVSHQLG